MQNRVKKEKNDANKLVIEEFIAGESVELKNGEKLEGGELLIFDDASKKYVKYAKATHKAKLGEARLRVYKDEESVSAGNDTKVLTLKQGRINKALFKAGFNGTLDADDYKLLAVLEQFNIHLEEVK